MKTLYTARATATGGRQGYAETDDKQLSFSMSPPGSGKPGTNPEQLFACGYAACFGGAVQHVAKKNNVDVGNVEVKSEVQLNQDDNNGFLLKVVLDITVPGADQAQAEKIVKEAHEVCPYSKATRGNIEVSLKANGQALRKAA